MRYSLEFKNGLFRIIDSKPNIKGEVGRCIRTYKESDLAHKFCAKANKKTLRRK